MDSGGNDGGPESSFSAAAFFNSYRVFVAPETAIGIDTSTLRYRSLPISRLPGGPTDLAEDFLANSKLTRGDNDALRAAEEYFTDPSIVMLTERDRQTEEPSIPLLKAAAIRMSLGEALSRRRSVRLFTADPIELNQLSSLCQFGLGATSEADVRLASGQLRTMRLRAAPSAGGLFPIRVFCAIQNVRNCVPAIYEYNSDTHCLVAVKAQGGLKELRDCFAVSEELVSKERASLIFLFAAHPWRSMRKYGARGMRLVLQEVGYISQTLHLICAALGLGSVDCAGFYDDEIDRLLGLDGRFRTVLHGIFVGVPG